MANIPPETVVGRKLATSTVAPALAAVSLALAAVAVVAGASAQTPRPDPSRAQPIQLVPHRAVYDFKLGRARSEKVISSLTGRMVYEFTGSACEGYSQTMRFVTKTSGTTGTTTVSDQRSNTWEDDTGMRFRFQSSQYRDQKLVEQAAGNAFRGEGEEDTRVELTHPDKKKSAIGGAAMFPVQHSLKLIDAARRGRTSLAADFFDGSEGGEKTYVVSAQIGKQVASGFNRALPRAGQSDKLDSVPAWPVMLSYYEHGSDKKDALPVYEMGFVFYANGVSRRLVIDNGEYTMQGELSEFTLLDAPPCRK